MKPKALRADFLLLLASAIWGLAFVAQRLGMDHMGPFAFNGARFALGSLVLLPLMIRQWRTEATPTCPPKSLYLGAALTSILLFLGASFQQIGMVSTQAGKAGFITGLYVILVPILGLFVSERARWGTWMGAVLAVLGLYFLSVTGKFTIAQGDVYVLLSALVWGFHVRVVGAYTRKIGALRLSLIQFAATAVLSFLIAFLVEEVDIQAWGGALIPILYAGGLSVGVGYTLQVVAQKDAPSAHAAILLSLESVFALVGGWLLLAETLTPRRMLGCALMLAGMWVSQLTRVKRI